MTNLRLALVLSGLYVGLAVLANWLASRFVVAIPLTPYYAPGGVFAIGAVLVLHDWLVQLRSARWALLLVPIGGGLTYLIGELAGFAGLQRIALASLGAFLVSETVEVGVLLPIRRRNFTLGVALSATVGNVVDSALFLYLAGFALFGPGDFFLGNVTGKLYAIAAGVAVTMARRRLLPVAVA